MAEYIKPGYIPNLPPFKAFLASNIPAVYDNTMSYYDELTALIHYIEKEVIPAVNNTGAATTQLQELFTELKSFVDNYFENLDVQEEINNKLDQMAEDGVLQEIIGSYLDATAVWGFDTVADMVASTNLVNGSYARTLGYNIKNDLGGGLYKIRTITNDDVVDGGSIIEMGDDTLVAELVYQDSITPEQYGCYGDGTHDDTVQFKKLLTYITAKELPLIGEGIYLITEAITIGNIDIFMPLAKIKTDYGITINEASNRTLNLPKVVSSVTNANYAGITLFECYSNNITINRIEGFTKGLLLTATSKGCVYNTISIVEITDCLNSVVLQPQSTGWVNENTFIGGRLLNTSGYTTTYGADIIKVALLGTSTHYINNNYFLHLCLEGEEGSSGGLKIKLSYTRSNKFEMCRYEGTDPKIDATNSDYDVISDGFNAYNLTFPNDPISVNFNETTSKIVRAGKANNYYKDIAVSSNSYPIFTCRNSSGQVGAKVLCDGFVAVTPSNGKDTYKLTSGGLNAWDNNNASYTMFRNYLTHTVACYADGTNRCFVISPGNNLSNSCYLWMAENHLRGKIGSAPSSATDGTIIL